VVSTAQEWVSADGLVRFLPNPEENTGGIYVAPGWRTADIKLAREVAEAAGYSAADGNDKPVDWDDPSAHQWAEPMAGLDLHEQLAAGRDETTFMEWCHVLVPVR
jgi:hypothetical protein